VPLAEPFTWVGAARTPQSDPFLAIDLWDAASTGIRPPRLPFADGVTCGRGEFAYEPTAQVRISFPHGIRRDGTFDAMTMLDERARLARYFVAHRDLVPAHDRAAPMRAVLQWRLNRSEHMLVHSGAVAGDGHAVLLAGPSGSGKSTTAVGALLAGFDCLGDDYVFLDMHRSPTVVHSLYTTAKLTDDAVRLLPGLDRHPGLGAWLGDKRVVNLTSLGSTSFRARPLTAIIVPHMDPARSGRLDRISPGAALLALAPTTVLHTPQRDAAELGLLGRLAKSVPAYRLALGGGDAIGDAAPMLAALLDRPAPIT
jgi:hypothetical protein